MKRIKWLFRKFAVILDGLCPSMMNFIKTSIYKIFALLMLLNISLMASAKDFVVVIDAGHGGHDHGAIDNGVREKTINLGVALKLGDMIKKQMEHVKIVYTRDDDTFLSLQARANVANKAHGDLFISIHTNSVDKKNRNRKKISGASTYTLGLHKTDENFAVAQRENSVMVLEKDYTTTYQGFDPNSTESYIMFELNQNMHMEQSVAFAQLVQSQMVENAGRIDKGVRQAGFWVLAATSMPAVLVELDFICNPDAAKFLGSASGQTKLAKSIFNAFRHYKESFDRQLAATQASLKMSDSKNNIAVDDSKKEDEKKGKKPVLKESKDKKKPTRRPDNEKDETPSNVTESTVSARNNESGKDDRDKQLQNGDTRDKLIYKIQFLTSTTEIEKGSKRFKGLYPISSYRDQGLVKYTVGAYSDWDDASIELQKVKEKFPDAFIVTFEDGKRIK